MKVNLLFWNRGIQWSDSDGSDLNDTYQIQAIMTVGDDHWVWYFEVDLWMDVSQVFYIKYGLLETKSYVCKYKASSAIKGHVHDIQQM